MTKNERALLMLAIECIYEFDVNPTYALTDSTRRALSRGVRAVMDDEMSKKGWDGPKDE